MQKDILEKCSERRTAQCNVRILSLCGVMRSWTDKKGWLLVIQQWKINEVYDITAITVNV